MSMNQDERKAKAHSDAIDRDIQRVRREHAHTIKILLLGIHAIMEHSENSSYCALSRCWRVRQEHCCQTNEDYPRRRLYGGRAGRLPGNLSSILCVERCLGFLGRRFNRLGVSGRIRIITTFKWLIFVQMTISDNLLSSMKIVLNGMGTLRISLANPANKVSLYQRHPCDRVTNNLATSLHEPIIGKACRYV